MEDSSVMDKAATYAQIFSDPDLFVPEHVWHAVLPPILAVGVIDYLQRNPGTAHHVWGGMSVGEILRVLEGAAVEFAAMETKHGKG